MSSVVPKEEYEMASMPSCSSDVVTNDGLVVNHPPNLTLKPTHFQPVAGNVDVTQCSNFHYGPKYVSITEHFNDIEVARARIRGVDLVTSKDTKRLRCSIAVFVCWAFVISFTLSFFICYFALYEEDKRLQLDIQKPWYVSRKNWNAKDSREIELLELPVSNVLIGHSATQFCTDKNDCIQKVLAIQTDHQWERRWADIGPNFLVGGNGMVFEGRGANIVGIMVQSWNTKGISIMFLGNYLTNETTSAQFDNVKVLLQELVKKGVLTTDYKVYGHCQVKGGYVSPGPHVMDNLYRLDHWNPVNKRGCVRS